MGLYNKYTEDNRCETFFLIYYHPSVINLLSPVYYLASPYKSIVYDSVTLLPVVLTLAVSVKPGVNKDVSLLR
jgi:hypothetical protein